MKGPLLAALLVAALPSQALRAEEYLHPKLRRGQTLIRAVMLLAPDVKVTKSSVSGPERMPQESDRLAAQLLRVISQALKERGFNVQPTFTEEVLQQPGPLRHTLFEIQRRYEDLASAMDRNPSGVAKGRFSLGDRVTGLSLALAPDAFVFIRATAEMMTPGKQALDGQLVNLILGQKPRSVFSHICLVDSVTGEVLFLSLTFAKGDFLSDAEKVVGAPIVRALQKIPF